METASPRLVAVGDIHGCHRELLQLLTRLALRPCDTLVFLGDYVDRGPESRGAIDLLLGYAEDDQAPRCIFLRGNHEQMMLDARTDDRAMLLWLANGGRATLDSAARRRAAAGLEPPVVWPDLFGPKTWSFLESTETLYLQGRYAFVHAGMDPGLTVAANVSQASRESFLWERRHLEPGRDLSAWDGHVVVCGHTIQAAPVDLPNVVCIDTGAFVAYTRGRPGALTAVILPEEEGGERVFVGVPSFGFASAGTAE